MVEIGGKQIPTTLAELADPKRTALLIWDMENAIGPNAFNYKDILGNLKSLSARARQIGVPVFYSATDPNQLLKEKEDPRDREIVDELKPQPKDIVFQKRRPDGFVGTDFDLILRSNGVRTILIGGVATEGGVEGTARTARNLGYDVVVLKDCVGSRNRELHEFFAFVVAHHAHHGAVPGILSFGKSDGAFPSRVEKIFIGARHFFLCCNAY